VEKAKRAEGRKRFFIVFLPIADAYHACLSGRTKLVPQLISIRKEIATDFS
jgi:hypothetical protein